MNKDIILSDRLYRSRVVSIGGLLLGGDHPVRLQSMTNTSTLDTRSTVDQCMRMADAGAEMLRITARDVKEALHLEAIKNELRKKGYHQPLVADIHFQPKAAEIAASIVEKVRINPGNYIDRTLGKSFSYQERSYNDELKKIASRLEPLLVICRKHKTVIRIGTNHGSLSQRIIGRYGNTPTGMAESALEFARICRDMDFHDLVFSMKASDVRIMVYATRLLIGKMQSEEMDYPLHLGVTEAGNGWDGRIRSAAGIGALLADGIGDTIRVSLTEAPEKEIPVARMITAPFEYMRSLTPASKPVKTDFSRVKSFESGPVGGDRKPVIIASKAGGKVTPDIVAAKTNILITGNKEYKLISAAQSAEYDESKAVKFLRINPENLPSINMEALGKINNAILILESTDRGAREDFRHLISVLEKHGIRHPVVFRIKNHHQEKEPYYYYSSGVISACFLDGTGDGLWLDVPAHKNVDRALETSFSILQFLRLRISKVEYIACPSCGRTLFNIEKVLSEVREKTKSLSGLKIAVMGCIVNGPGEMADADYGYVGSVPGKVTLYRKQNVVKKNIPEEQAVDALVDLIKANNDWK